MELKERLNDVMVRTVQEFTPPLDVQLEASRGLELRTIFKRGGTEVGQAMAEHLAAGKPVSARTIARMYSYFARHEVDKRGKNFFNAEKPSNGFIAWLLWGGDKGQEWVREIRNTSLNTITLL